MTTEIPPADDREASSGRFTADPRSTTPELSPAADIAVVQRALRRLAIGAAAVVLVSIPALYAASGLRSLQQHAVLEAAMTAERITDNALTADSGWDGSMRGPRQILNLATPAGVQVERTLLGPEGGVLVASAVRVERPVLQASARVVVSGTHVADVAVGIGLRPMLWETSLVVIFAGIVAIGVYLVVDRAALRALRRALDHLQTALRQRDQALLDASDAVSQLGRQNARLKNASEELSRARDAALTADRSKSMFLAAMSHELRTPLNAIIGFSEIMARQLYGPIGHERYRDYAADIRASGDHLLALIDDVLDLSRVEAGKLSLRREPLPVSEQMEACCRLVQGRAEEAGIDLRLMSSLRPDVAILGDRVRFRQIVLNLLTNAVKFTERGGRVTVDTAAAPDNGVAIRITDTGIGMSDADLERVFRPFERIDVGASRPSEGVGLGLALSRALVRAHDGKLHVASTPGRGTTVTLTFPGLAGDADGDPRRQMSLGDALRDDSAPAR